MRQQITIDRLGNDVHAIMRVRSFTTPQLAADAVVFINAPAQAAP